MFPSLLSPDLVDRIRRWDDLKQWERREIGQTLRRMGLTYREISAVIPVSKGTLSTWCRDLELTSAQRARIGAFRSDRRDVGAELRRRARERDGAHRTAARDQAAELMQDPFWVAGVVAYWAEGSKGQKSMRFANSDPEMIRLFVSWVGRYLGVAPSELRVQLHLHNGQDEGERITFWSSVTGVPTENFLKTFVKPEGTGHRKNVLYQGTATIRVPRSSVHLQQVLGWADAIAENFADLRYTAAGR